MILSAWAWAGSGGGLDYALAPTRVALAVSLVLIVGGAAACQLGGAVLVDAKTAPGCAPGHPRCDVFMLAGEGGDPCRNQALARSRPDVPTTRSV